MRDLDDVDVSSHLEALGPMPARLNELLIETMVRYHKRRLDRQQTLPKAS